MPSVQPEVRRLITELFRRVGVPYYEGFAETGPLSLFSIVDYALGADQVVKRDIVRSRLSRPGIGKWVCPRKTRSGPSRSESTALHPAVQDAPGTCPVVDEKTGAKCGAVLKVKETHLDEFAAAFGFLEAMNGSYARGKFGAVAELLTSLENEGGYFDGLRAREALLTVALLERHGDLVLPFLEPLRVSMQPSQLEFVERVQTSLLLKRARFANPDVPRNNAYAAAVQYLDAQISDWGAGAGTSGPGSRLDYEKTLGGYYGRTRRYLIDCGVLSNAKSPTLSPKGTHLVAALGRNGYLGEGSAQDLAPTFESMLDAFSLTWTKYTNLIATPFTPGQLEQLIVETLFPNRAVEPWKTYETELSEAYPGIVRRLSDPLSGSARLDIVRLALFVWTVGKGLVLSLDSRGVDGDYDPNANASIQLSLADSRRYALGHARTSRRFWSVTLLRRGEGPS